MKFFDADFPPLDSSLYPDELSYPFDATIKWVRASKIFPGQSLKLFGKSLGPGKIIERSLGDSWLLGAISTLAEYPNLIEKLFVNKVANQEGIYRVRLCKNGEWQQVTVDDYFPCTESGVPVFTVT